MVAARFSRTVDPRALVRSVRRRTGLDERKAEQALAAVVRELGGCLTVGEAFNLAELLPRPLARECRLGALSGGAARFSPEAFIRAVAERERVTRDEAARRVASVLAALREQLPEERLGRLAEELARLRALQG